MSKRITALVIALIALFVMIAAVGCDRRPQRTSMEVEMLCTKGADVPLHAKSGGEGEVRQSLSEGSKVTVLRTKEGWNLVRVNTDRQSGWIEASRLGACAAPSKAGKAPAKAN